MNTYKKPGGRVVIANLLANNLWTATGALLCASCVVGGAAPSTLAMTTKGFRSRATNPFPRAALRFGSGNLDVTLSLRVNGLWAYLSIS
jgi:hypothetical protein